MGLCNHTRADLLLIAQASGTIRHRDAQHRDRWPDLVQRLHTITTDPHLLAHAAGHTGPPEVDELLELAGADLEEAARIRARAPYGGLAGFADRMNRRPAD